jgi:polysaccharide biosynthesis transport protein
VAGLMPRRGKGFDDEAARIEARTLARMKQDIDRSVAGDSGRIVALVPADAGDDPQAIPALCEALASGGDTVLAVNAGGLTPGMAQRINAIKGVELWKASDLKGLLPRVRSGREAGPGDLRGRYRFILLCLPPLTTGAFPETLATTADTTVVLVPWGKVTPDLLREALIQQGDALRPVATTVLTGADLKRARLYMRPGDYEERLLHAV